MRKKTIEALGNKKTGGIGIVQLATYTSPKVVEIRNQDWINYGDDNNYFGYLQDRINGSPTNNAIVNGISQMIFGKGLDATDSLTKPLDYAKAKMLLDDDTVERLCNDLKAMGQCAIQVIYSIDRKQILECNHFPVETLRSGKCNADGEVECYYYSDNWLEVNRNKKPKAIPAFGFGQVSSELVNSEEILYIKPYKTGFYYYSPVDYQGGLQYCELEEEISNYHLNNIMNGLAPSMLINFNNGTPTEDEQRDIERNIAQKFGGTSNAGRFILSFNDSTEYNATITPVQLSDAHSQYQFLSDESMRKIMVAHRVISPMLLGIKDTTGFGNNAEELKTASVLMDNTVIRPFQNLLIKEFNRILSYNKIALNLYFKTLQPLEFNDLSNATNIETVEEETGQKQNIPAVAPKLSALEDICYDINSFDGEKISDEWILADKREVLDCNTSIKDWANKHVIRKEKLGGYIKSYPSKESYLDEDIYKVRYEYSEKYSSANSREFCVNMMNRTANGVVYRIEDIDSASFDGINNEFGHEGENYSLFRFKGGVNCGHYWTENLYRLKQNTDGSYYEDKALSSSEQVSSIDGYYPNPEGMSDAEKAPFDMRDRGHHPNYNK
jgi:hypothetical protein